MKKWRGSQVKKKGFLLFLFFGLLVGCSQNHEEKSNIASETPEPVEVVLEVPETAAVGKIILLQAQVTQGEEKVSDAEEVVFEVWKDGDDENSILIDYEEEENGTYWAETVFESEGKYVVQVHVTARRMHVMPKAEVLVTKATEEAETEAK